MKNKYLNLALLFMILSSLPSIADTIELNDGSKIIGEVTTISKNKISIKTKYCGEQSFDLTNVKNYLIEDKKVNIVTKDGDTFTGAKIEGNEKEVVIKNEKVTGGSFSLKVEDMDRIWDTTLTDPAYIEPFKNKWTYELSAGVKGKTGNGESKDADVNASASLETKSTTFKMYAVAIYSESDRELSDSKMLAGIDFEQRFGKRSSWYVRDEMQRDNVKQQNFRNVAAAGYGIYFLRNDKMTLRYRIGIGHTFESYDFRNDKSTATLDMGLHFVWKITNYTSLISELTYEPSLKGLSDCRIWHESKIRTKLTQFKDCSLEAGISNEYYSVVDPGNDYLDTNYFTRIVFRW